MKKILLLDTSIATNNIGDSIINDSVAINWPELYSLNYIMRFPTHTPPYSWWQQLFFSKRIKSQKEVDYRFLMGTNALYMNMLRPLPQWNIHLLDYSYVKDTILLGVGMGVNSNNISFYTKWLYSKVLNKKYIHSVRDEFTKNILMRMGYRAYNTGCPTMWGLTPEHCRKIPQIKSDRVLFTLTNYHANHKHDKLMVEILSSNYKELYFWPQTIDDLDYLKSLGDFKYIVISPNLSSYDDILNLTDIDYIGNRLHGGIRALQHLKRTLIVSIDYRADNISKQYSIPIIKRGEIQNNLERFINNKYETQISGIDWELIEKWKQQFDFE